MLFRLLLFRLCPLLILRFLEERKRIKIAMIGLLVIYGIVFVIAVGDMISVYHWWSLLYIPMAMFPHYICYGFAIWILIRCIWHAWSERVWKRIYFLTIVSTILGILMEYYWSPQILQFFTKI